MVPDLGRKLPGRGLWVEASRASIETAVKKNGFTRAAKTRLNAPADLADTVERLLARRCLDQLGLARREGVLISGFEKSAASIRSGKAAWVIEAADGSADGRGKVLALARHQTAKVCGAFTADDLSWPLGWKMRYTPSCLRADGPIAGPSRSNDWLDFGRFALLTGRFPVARTDRRERSPQERAEDFGGRGPVS